MIQVIRTPQPEYYRSSAFKEYFKKMSDFYQTRQRSQQRFFPHNLKTIGKIQQIKADLEIVFNNKCAYCESVTEGEVDQFRPKNGARNLNKDYAPNHYWWLSMEWENQYLSCSLCNRNKGSWFPVIGDRIRVGALYPEVFSEQKLLIDPCYDYPEDHIYFNNEGVVFPKTKLGELSIDIIKLNRRALIEMRKQAYDETLMLLKSSKASRILQSFDSEVKAVINKIQNNTSKSSYLAMRKLAVAEFSKRKNIFVAEKTLELSVDYEKRKSKLVKNCYVSSFKINNFKSIKNLQINVSDKCLNSSVAPWTVFLGENGLGKSSILQALCLSLIDPDYANDFISGFKILNNKSSKGFVEVILDDQSHNRIDFNSNEKKILSNFISVSNYVIAYGSTRLAQQSSLRMERGTKYFKVRNLFDHTAAIRNAEKWLLGLKNKRSFTSAANIIKAALDLDNSYRLTKSTTGLILIKGNSKISLEQLSDGFKSSISLIVDILSVLNRGMENFENIEGIVFIDELELHLHPRWKMKYITSFRKAFPKVQVFATTHDPLCLKGLYEGEVVVLKEVNKTTQVITDLPDVSTLKAEQLLTSEFFGLSSTVDHLEEARFDHYYLLLSKSKLTPSEKEEVKVLRESLPKEIQLGDSLRDDLILTAIDELVAAQYKTKNIKTRQELKTSTQNIVSQLLKTTR